MQKRQITRLLLNWGYRAIDSKGTLVAFNRIKTLFMCTDNTVEDITRIERKNEGIQVYFQYTFDEEVTFLVNYDLDDDIEQLRDWIEFGSDQNKYRLLKEEEK